MHGLEVGQGRVEVRDGTDIVGRVNFCQKHPNMLDESFYCVFWCTDQPQKIQHDSSTP